jgi:hypothetical protein
MKLRLAVPLLAALAAPASAQFDQFHWTLSNPGGVNAWLEPSSMLFQTDLFGLTEALATYTTQAPTAGRVSVLVDYFVEESVCDAATPLKILGTTSSAITGCSDFLTLELDVEAEQSFGFGLQVNSPSWSATLHLTQFSFTPYWVALGGALAGSAGTPALAGEGILQPGKAFRLELAQAAAAAPVALVVGLSAANLPFKGGVLVPSIDRLISGLVTNGSGQLTLASTWPAGFPVGFEVLVQAWIADAGGPEGFAASNAVKGEVL